MIGEGTRVLLIGEGREYYVRAGKGTLSTDLGTLDLGLLVGAAPGDTVATHIGKTFSVRTPRAVDHFAHASRSGAPMLPKDIGTVVAYTGMSRNDDVLDAGTGSGIAAIYFGGIARSVRTCEVRAEFARQAAKNIEDAQLGNVEVVAGDVLDASGVYDIVHLDMQIGEAHIVHAHSLLRPGGFLACYTPFIEQMMQAMDAASRLFADVHTYEMQEREMTRSARGTRPATRVGHSGYITIARR